MRAKKLKPIRIPSARSENQPATRKLLYLVRDQILHKVDERFARNDGQLSSFDERFASIDQRFASIDQRFAQIDERFASIDQRFAQIDERFAQVDQRFAQIDEKLSAVQSEISRLGVMIEEQNANNRIVLEGLQALWQRQDRIEKTIAAG